MTKKCGTCKLIKPVTEFSFKSKKNNIRTGQCRDCHNAYAKKHYISNKTSYIKRSKKNSAKYAKRNAKIINAFKYNGCSLCNEKEICCLHAHHLNPNEKEYNIARMQFHSVKTLMIELNKCMCVCANCHLKIHAGLINIPNE